MAILKRNITASRDIGDIEREHYGIEGTLANIEEEHDDIEGILAILKGNITASRGHWQY